MEDNCFKYFKSPNGNVDLPEKFTFPFYYNPHPLALQAAKELQDFLGSFKVWDNCFGFGENPSALEVGKMFGVLVVKNMKNKLGYLQAFSGKIIDTNVWEGFVPPLFEVFEKGNKFIEVSAQLTKLTEKLKTLQGDENYLRALKDLKLQKKSNEEILKAEKQRIKEAQKNRRAARKSAIDTLSNEAIEQLALDHNQESLNLKFMYREYGEYLKNKLFPLQQAVDEYESSIAKTKQQRKEMSMDIQQWIFDKYNFINTHGEVKNVVDIFKNTIAEIPPSGAGDCAAPKLLQYAFENNLKPIALAEFWWGKSPSSAIRKHGYYYPSCRGKCEPILGHMLKGLNVDENPMLTNPAIGKNLSIVYEDDVIAVINKPAEFLSVPGKIITDSVQERMKERYPEATGPLIVHRLDMSTSGLLLIAKTKDVHKHLQEQFLKRTVKKRYVAVLDGIVEDDTGFVDLPLRVDLDNRPCQMVDFKNGKSARTKWEVIERSNGKTRVYFYPITGRTHQLRMHAAHHDGLNAPIVGDDLYGLKADRLHLHAEVIEFVHPVTKEVVSLCEIANF